MILNETKDYLQLKLHSQRMPLKIQRLQLSMNSGIFFYKETPSVNSTTSYVRLAASMKEHQSLPTSMLIFIFNSYKSMKDRLKTYIKNF
jgi:hypothetical protein